MSKKTPLVIGGVVAAVAALGVTLVLVLGGNSARDTVQTYVSAANAGDIRTMIDLVCSDGKAKAREQEPSDKKNGFFEVTIIDVTEDGDTATAKLQTSAMGYSLTTDLALRKQDGEWCLPNLLGLR